MSSTCVTMKPSCLALQCAKSGTAFNRAARWSATLVLGDQVVLALGVADPAREHREQRQRDLRVALEDPAEVPPLDTEARRRLERADRRRSRELVEEGHLAEDLA